MLTVHPGVVNQHVTRFFEEHPSYSPATDCLLNHKDASRWFDLLRSTISGNIYTFENILQSRSGPSVQANDCVFFMMSSYDYLGLIGHPEIEEAAVQAIRKYGTGTGGVRLLTGTNQLHEQLESSIGRFVGTGSAMVFNSGYMANIAAITALFKKNDRIIIDEFVHHSIRDGLRILGIVPLAFRHNDMNHLETLLAPRYSLGRTIIITEGVFSMDGDICPLPCLVQLKKKYDALLMIDEAHSFGVLGKTGKGVHEHFHLDADEVEIYTGSLSKAIPTNGGFIAARKEVILYLKHSSGPYVFSSALTPPNTACAIRALELLEQEPQRLQALWQNTVFLHERLKRAGADLGQSCSPVLPVLTGDPGQALLLARLLYDRGFIANAVVYPAVPATRARLRICCTAAQTTEQMLLFADAIKESLELLNGRRHAEL